MSSYDLFVDYEFGIKSLESIRKLDIGTNRKFFEEIMDCYDRCIDVLRKYLFFLCMYMKTKFSELFVKKISLYLNVKKFTSKILKLDFHVIIMKPFFMCNMVKKEGEMNNNEKDLVCTYFFSFNFLFIW